MYTGIPSAAAADAAASGSVAPVELAPSDRSTVATSGGWPASGAADGDGEADGDGDAPGVVSAAVVRASAVAWSEIMIASPSAVPPSA